MMSQQKIFKLKFLLFMVSTQLFKSFEFENGSRMSDENLVIHVFKYLQNKKWQKQAVKLLE